MAILKLLHVLCVFLWIGTLLTLSRFMGYLPKEAPLVQERVAKIVRRIYLLVDLPSMVLAVVLGIILFFFNGVNWKAPWLHMKLTFAFMIIISDLITGRLILKQVIGTGRPYKILHGIIGLFFIGVLIAIYVLKQRFCVLG